MFWNATCLRSSEVRQPGDDGAFGLLAVRTNPDERDVAERDYVQSGEEETEQYRQDECPGEVVSWFGGSIEKTNGRLSVL